MKQSRLQKIITELTGASSKIVFDLERLEAAQSRLVSYREAKKEIKSNLKEKDKYLIKLAEYPFRGNRLSLSTFYVWVPKEDFLKMIDGEIRATNKEITTLLKGVEQYISKGGE